MAHCRDRRRKPNFTSTSSPNWRLSYTCKGTRVLFESLPLFNGRQRTIALRRFLLVICHLLLVNVTISLCCQFILRAFKRKTEMRKTAVIVGIALSVVLAVVALASSRHITMVVSQDMEFFLPSSSLFQMESPHREDSSANVTDEITDGLNETVGGVEENDESAKAVVEVTPINRLGIPRKKLEFLHIGKVSI